MILYDSHFWGKKPALHHSGATRMIILISLSCTLGLNFPWSHIFCCFAFPILDLAEGSEKRWWVKSCVTAAEVLLCQAFGWSLGDFFGQWLYILILHMCFHQPFLMCLLCCSWVLPSQGQYWHYPRNTVFSTGKQSNPVFPQIWNWKEQHFQAAVEDELRVTWNGWLLHTKLGAKPPMKSSFTREAMPFHLLLGFRFLMFYCVRIIIQLYVWHRY